MKFAATMAACLMGLAARSLKGHMQRRSQPKARTSFSDLPALVINTIITSSDSNTRLALFRTCGQLRDAVLGHAAASTSEQLSTQLHLTADYACHTLPGRGDSPQAASRLLQVAATSAHNVHLHLQSSHTLDTAVMWTQYWPSHLAEKTIIAYRILCRLSTPLTNRLLPDILLSSKAWLAGTFKPWVAGHSQLQNITAIYLRDMVLEHAMPDSIGRACPALRVYQLDNVAWPDIIPSSDSIMAWPRVEQLVLKDVCPYLLPHFFNPSTLPQLESLHVVWSETFDKVQRSTYRGSGTHIGDCCVGFQQQLKTLQLENLPWYMVMNRHLSESFPSLTELRLPRDGLERFQSYCKLELKNMGYDNLVQYIVAATPKLERFQAGVLSISKGHASIQWPKLQRLQVDAIEGDALSSLACMPHMPALNMVTIPSNNQPVSIKVGSKWLDDVAKVIGAQATGSDRAAGQQEPSGGPGRKGAWARAISRFGRKVIRTALGILGQLAAGVHVVAMVAV